MAERDWSVRDWNGQDAIINHVVLHDKTLEAQKLFCESGLDKL
jgi:hypothetical protein